MDKLITAFPQNITSSLESASKINFKTPAHEIKNLVFIGMGGSGIGAKIVSGWVQDEIKIPVQLLQDYTLPKFVDKHTLIIACSYSGNTEETLACLLLAKNQDAHIVGICSGGKLETFCNDNGFDCVVIPGGNPPRSATAFSVIHISNILVKFNLIDSKILKTLANSTQIIDDNLGLIKEEANKLAVFLKDKVAVFYSTTEYEPVLIRARQQFNENSKLLCIHHVIPEMNHNELVGWGGGNDTFATVFFDTKDMNIQNEKRFELTRDEVSKRTANVLTIDAKGKNKIERTFYLIHIVDWASLYLSTLKQVDPMDIICIDYLKSELGKL